MAKNLNEMLWNPNFNPANEVYVDKFIYLRIDISSTENDVNLLFVKYGRLGTGYWSYGSLINPTKKGYIQSVAVSVLIYGCTTWTLPKRNIPAMN